MVKDTLKIFWQATWRYKGLLIWGEIGATIFILAYDIAQPLLVGEAINRLSAGATSFNDFSQLLWWFFWSIIVFLLARRLMMWTYITMEPRAVRDLENLAFDKLQRHSAGFYADNFSGALVAKVNRFTSGYQRVLDSSLGDFSNLFRRMLFAFIIIFILAPLIGIVFFVWVVLFSWSLVYFHKRKLPYSQRAATAQTKVTARLADVITNAMAVKAFARRGEEAVQFRALTEERRQLRFKTFFMGDLIRIYKGIWVGGINFLVLYLSIRFSLNGVIAIGSVVIIQLYLNQIISQLWNLGRFVDAIEEALADASEMTEIITAKVDITDPKNPQKLEVSDGVIEFHDVGFQYKDAHVDTLLFSKLSLVIPAGQKVGLVGPSGGGKTTITKLLLRYMDLNGGSITLDGQDISQVTQDDLRTVISYVPQESMLFHRTILENIAYGNPTATKEDIVSAAQKAHAHEFIEELPKHYQTVVGERGVKLSGGQRQRIAIARAMLKNSPILILDEATSSLDSESEKYITDALDKLMVQRTTIVIAHRLSTIKKMDRILVLERGKIVQDGSHEELLKDKKGLYARLWAHQTGIFIGSE